MNTKDRIKVTAVEMFNEKGATNVSTVQLSDRLGISPGNLYYYFDNKEHLIRDLWTEDIITNIDMLFFREDFGHSENGILNFFMDYSRAIYKFRFYYAEVFVLLKNDPIMLDLYKVMDSWEETGIMNPLSVAEKKILAGNLWITVQTWTNFVATMNDKYDEKTISNDIVVHAYALLAPHFTYAARKRISVLMRKKGISEHLDMKEFEL
jgi:AcrR family transcriptional regulator